MDKLHDINGGVVSDFGPLDQPENTATFAVGATLVSDGEVSSFQSEEGNVLAYSLSPGYIGIGKVNLNDNEVLIFSVNPTSNKDEIGLAYKNTYTTLVNSECLDFNKCNTIKGEFRLRNGCDRVIYFIDGVNPDRYIDIDNLSNFYSSGLIAHIAGGGTIDTYVGEKWDCDSFELIPHFQMATISTSVNNTGGSIEPSKLFFVARYLDSNLTPTDWFNISDEVNITQNTTYNDIMGGYDLTNFSAELGGINPTTKSIDVTVSNIDTSYAYVELGVIQYKSGDGVTASGFLADRIAADTSSKTVTYTGSTGLSILDVASVTTRSSNYRISKAIEQFDSRLLRGNLKEPYRDWGAFQQKANAILTEYNIADGSTVDNFDTYNSKNSVVVTGFMRDEVYALGIVFVFDDGSFSPVFHIPGREADTDSRINITQGNANSHYRDSVSSNWDTNLLTVVASGATGNQVNLADVEHLGLVVTDTIERWKVYNTAINGTNDILSYYETSQAYPDIEDSNGTRIFPTGNVRHHKMPDATLEPIFANASPDTSKVLELIVSNIDVPTGVTDVQGFFIVKAKEEKTVLDKGLLTYALRKIELGGTEDDYIYQPMPFYQYTDDYTFNDPNPDVYATNPSNKELDYGMFHSPNLAFNDTVSIGTHFKIENVIECNHDRVDIKDDTPSSLKVHVTWGGRNDDTAVPNFSHRKIDNTAVVPYNNFIEDFGAVDFDVYNTGGQQKIIVTKLSSEMEDYASSDTTDHTNTSGVHYVLYASLKTTSEVYTDIFDLEYRPIHYETNISFPVTVNPLNHGETYISEFIHKKTVDTNGFFDWQSTSSALIREQYCASYTRFACESSINTDLKHIGTGSTDQILFLNKTSTEFLAATIEDRDGDGNDESNFDELFYRYSKDYSATKQVFKFFPLPETWNYNDNCQDEDRNLIVYSEVALNSGPDNYRRFLVNSSLDIEGHAGEITNIFSKDRSLFVHTDRSLFQLAPNARVLESSQDAIYVGTGSLFTIPAQEILRTDHGYAGNQGRFNTQVTEFGILFIDQLNRRVYNLSDGLNPIDLGVSWWFRNNLNNYIIDELKLLGATYDCVDSIIKDYGVGIHTVYDPNFKRYIIHHKNFKPTSQIILYSVGDSPDEGDLLYNNDTKEFGKWESSAFVGIDFSDENYFENKSWTRSYHLDLKQWSGFHHYKPDFMYNDSETFYTGIDNTIYKHKDANEQVFYGSKRDFIIEFVIKGVDLVELERLAWTSRTLLYDETNEQWIQVDDTFDKILVYNNDQCTFENNLTLKADNEYNVTWNNFSKKVDKVKDEYRVSEIRDLINTRGVAMFTSDWNNSTYQNINTSNNNYIDKVPLTSSYDLTKSLYETEPLTGKWFKVRLYFNKESNYKIILDFLRTKQTLNIR